VLAEGRGVPSAWEAGDGASAEGTSSKDGMGQTNKLKYQGVLQRLVVAPERVSKISSADTRLGLTTQSPSCIVKVR